MDFFKDNRKLFLWGAVVTIVLVVVVMIGARIHYVNNDWDYLLQKEWEDILSSGLMTAQGEIVHISALEDGYLVYVDADRGGRNFLLEVMVNEDTRLEGNIQGVALDDMIKGLIPGASVNIWYYNHGTELLVPGKSVVLGYALTAAQDSG